MFLACKQHGTTAEHTITVVDQAAEAPHHKTVGGNELFNSSLGEHKFMSLECLRSRPGYLLGDRLVLRARVAVME